MKKRRVLLGIVPVLMVAVLIVLAADMVTGGVGSTLPPAAPTPSPPTHIPEPRSAQDTLSSEERERIKARRGTPEWGPHTAGTVIEIAGRQVQLPADVHVHTVIAQGLCPPGEDCLDFPAWVLKRGDLLMAIGKESGRFAPGNPNEEAFDFIREALR